MPDSPPRLLTLQFALVVTGAGVLPGAGHAAPSCRCSSRTSWAATTWRSAWPSERSRSVRCCSDRSRGSATRWVSRCSSSAARSSSVWPGCSTSWRGLVSLVGVPGAGRHQRAFFVGAASMITDFPRPPQRAIGYWSSQCTAGSRSGRCSATSCWQRPLRPWIVSAGLAFVAAAIGLCTATVTPADAARPRRPPTCSMTGARPRRCCSSGSSAWRPPSSFRSTSSRSAWRTRARSSCSTAASSSASASSEPGCPTASVRSWPDRSPP